MENIVEMIIYIILVLLTFAGMWKTYEKAGVAGWKAIIPIYNMVVLARIIKKPWWWALLMLIPYLGIIWSVWVVHLLAKAFGKDILYTLGLVFLPFIFYPMLGYGNAKFIGVDATDPSDADDTDIVDDFKETANNMYDSAQDVVADSTEKAADHLEDQEQREEDK